MNHLAVLLTEIWRGRLNTHACNAPFLEQMPEDHACELSPLGPLDVEHVLFTCACLHLSVAKTVRQVERRPHQRVDKHLQIRHDTVHKHSITIQSCIPSRPSWRRCLRSRQPG